MAMLIDSTSCIGCKACLAACKQENGLATDNNYLKMHPVEFLNDHYVRYYAHVSCRHCSEPQCAAVCPVGAIKSTDDGVVLHNELLCIGCQVCAAVCPYAAMGIMNNGLVGKCTLCQERLSSGLSPACVDLCPTGARVFDTKEKVAKLAREREIAAEKKGYKAQIVGLDNHNKVLTLLPNRITVTGRPSIPT